MDSANMTDTDEDPAAQTVRDDSPIFEAFFRNAPVAMLLLDEERRIHEINRAAEAMLAISAAELRGRRFGEVVCCTESFNSAGGCEHGTHCVNCTVRSVVVETVKTGQEQRQVEAQLVVGAQQNPDERYVLVSAALSGAPGSRQVLVCIEDITARKRAELQLHDALLKVQQLRDRLHQENVYLREEFRYSHGFEEIVGQSEPIKLTINRARHVASTDANVLLLGETGTGKELFARAIHNSSPRRDRALVKVNCAALPTSLIESELFGHVQGAFTGALADKVGRFELADGGTIFLDEIGELDPELQAKLLQVLQDGAFERIGGTKTLTVDVRVIAATNRDLPSAMRDGSFRPDLYYRLAVFPIEIPPLRQRREDIPLLIWHFITARQGMLGKTFEQIPEPAMRALVEYDWPGNVRELENVVERAMILSPGPALMLEGTLPQPVASSRSPALSGSLEDVDRAHIVSVLQDCNWRIKGAGNAADRLGLNPSTLRYRMKKLGIHRPPRQPR